MGRQVKRPLWGVRMHSLHPVQPQDRHQRQADQCGVGYTVVVGMEAGFLIPAQCLPSRESESSIRYVDNWTLLRGILCRDKSFTSNHNEHFRSRCRNSYQAVISEDRPHKINT
jgi:hypothetical protein